MAGRRLLPRLGGTVTATAAGGRKTVATLLPPRGFSRHQLLSTATAASGKTAATLSPLPIALGRRSLHWLAVSPRPLGWGMNGNFVRLASGSSDSAGEDGPADDKEKEKEGERNNSPEDEGEGAGTTIGGMVDISPGHTFQPNSDEMHCHTTSRLATSYPAYLTPSHLAPSHHITSPFTARQARHATPLQFIPLHGISCFTATHLTTHATTHLHFSTDAIFQNWMERMTQL